jgi:hypothetical protein
MPEAQNVLPDLRTAPLLRVNQSGLLVWYAPDRY